MNNIDSHPVVSRAEWLTARLAHLAREKNLTHQRDQLNAERRALPWVKIDQPYTFETTEGRQTLAQLFGHNSQLIVYHFMFATGWEAGCKGCSFLADHLDGANLHLAHHDISLVAVSHAPLQAFQPFKQRMGWQFEWVSSTGNSFNEDFHVSATDQEKSAGKMHYNYETTDYIEEEMPGVSIFYKNAAGEVFHTYSAYARGLDILVGAYNYLDLTPKGRNEEEIMEWVRLHDQYDGAAGSAHCCSEKQTQ